MQSRDHLKRSLTEILLQQFAILTTYSSHVRSSLTSATGRSRYDVRTTIATHRERVEAQQRRDVVHTVVTIVFARGRHQSQRRCNSNGRNRPTLYSTAVQRLTSSSRHNSNRALSTQSICTRFHNKTHSNEKIYKTER